MMKTILAALLAAGTAGCSVNSPFQTSKTQSISDGVAVELDDVHVNNLALVSGEAGGDATVTGVVENTSSEDLTFTLSAGDAKVEAEVPANRLVNLSDDDKLTLEGLEAGPGDMTEVEISTGALASGGPSFRVRRSTARIRATSSCGSKGLLR